MRKHAAMPKDLKTTHCLIVYITKMLRTFVFPPGFKGTYSVTSCGAAVVVVEQTGPAARSPSPLSPRSVYADGDT